MIDLLILARWLHVIGACILLGTGAGIAFFMLAAHRTRNPALVAHVAATVVVADCLFTASAVLLQPVTGIWLASLTGWPLSTGWIRLALTLYVLVGCLWLPVVWIQLKMRNLASTAAETGEPLSGSYFRLFRLWFWLGVPAFTVVLAIVWLMMARPQIPDFL